jgi:hypothetical protein
LAINPTEMNFGAHCSDALCKVTLLIFVIITPGTIHKIKTEPSAFSPLVVFDAIEVYERSVTVISQDVRKNLQKYHSRCHKVMVKMADSLKSGLKKLDLKDGRL